MRFRLNKRVLFGTGKNIVSKIYELISNADFWNFTQRLFSAFYKYIITFNKITVYILYGVICPSIIYNSDICVWNYTETNYDTMYMRL